MSKLRGPTARPTRSRGVVKDTGVLQDTERWITEKDKTGRTQFANGQYEAAVTTYNYIISSVRHAEKIKHKWYNESLFLMFDARAAALEKIGDIPGARRDAECMTRLLPRNLRGYMRKARVRLLDRKPEEACVQYRKGLSACNGDDPNRRKATQLLEMLEVRIKTGYYTDRRRDPTDLPLEILHIIFGHLSYTKRLHCSRVSKAWRAAISSTTMMRTEIDTSKSKKPLAPKALNALVQRVREPRRLVINSEHIKGDLASGLERYIVRSTSLVELRMLGGDYQSHIPFLLRCPHTLETPTRDLFHKTCKLCSTSWAHNLRTFEDTTVPTLEEVTNLLNSSPRLEHLIVRVGSVSRAGSGLWVHEMHKRESWQSVVCPPLKTLTVGIHCCEEEISFFLDYVILKASSSLVDLTIKEEVFCDKNFASMPDLSSLQALESLRITECGRLPIFPSSLKHLRLGLFDTTRDYAALTFVRVPSLETLDLDFKFTFSNVMDQELEYLGAFLAAISRTNSGRLQVLRLPELHMWGAMRTLFASIIFRSVRELKVELNYPDADDDIDDLVKAFPDLERLDISGSHITGCSVRTVLNGLPRLKFLDLRCCDKMSPDTRKLLDFKGIDYEWDEPLTFPDWLGESKGRMVRYE